VPPVSTTPSRLASVRTFWLLITLFIIYGGAIPFHFSAGLSGAAEKLRTLPLNPLVSPVTGHRVSIPDAVQNVLLFLPFGVLGVLAVSARERSPLRVLRVTALGAALSTSVETMQLFTVDRVTALSDILMNTIGAGLGAIAAGTIDRVARRLLVRAEAAGLTSTDAFPPMIAATLLIVIAAWEPFDVTLELGTVSGKLHALARDVWQAGVPTDEGVALIHYTLFAVAACRWREAIRRPHVALWVAVVGTAAAFGLEACQVAITSRMPSLEDALVRAGGVFIGIGCWRLAQGRVARTFWLGTMIVATAMAALVQELSPFDIAPVHRPFGLMPFLSIYAHTTFDALSHVIELVLLYAPLGFVARTLLAGRRRGLTLALGATFLIALPVEYLQGWIVGRYPDVTDVAISVAGGWVGVWAAEQSRTGQQPQTPPPGLSAAH